MLKIVLINGSGGVGKDTVCDISKNFCDFVYNFSTVYEIKKVATILGWDGSKDEKSRKFLSDLKLLSTKYNNFPFNNIVSMCKTIREHEEGTNEDVVIFIHCREPQELKKLQEALKCKSLLVTNKNVGEIQSNMADANVTKYSYDYIIKNDGSLHDLHELVRGFIHNLFTE